MQGTKEVAQTWRKAKMEDSLRVGALVGERIFGSEDAKEGPVAFAEKREPRWQGR